MGVLEENKAVVTYETLFELLRLEKGREELQKLDYNFLEEISKYVKEKRDFLKHQTSLDAFSSDERENAEKQLHNTQNMLKQLYDRREKKIMQMAINNARLGMSLTDKSSLLPPEKRLFDELVSTLESYRREILDSMINPKIDTNNSVHIPKSDFQKMAPQEEAKHQSASKEMLELNPDTKMVRFTTAVPKFVGLDLEIYGPFEEDDVANMPKEIADVLVEKGRAEELGKKEPA